MRRTARLLGVVLAVVLVLGALAPAHAHTRWSTGVFVGVGPYWGPYPYWWYPPPYYYPPVIIQQEPPVYIQQEPLAAPPAPPPTAYWYYCQSARAYYPSVQSCPEEWVKVPPRP